MTYLLPFEPRRLDLSRAAPFCTFIAVQFDRTVAFAVHIRGLWLKQSLIEHRKAARLCMARLRAERAGNDLTAFPKRIRRKKRTKRNL